MDGALVRAVNTAVRRSPWTVSVTHAAASGLAPVEVALMLLLAVRGRRRDAVRMLVAVATVYVACELLGAQWPRVRPFATVSGVRALIGHDEERSFPSRHVASGLAMASIGRGRLGTVMAIVACALGVSRVAAGVHYPSDIVGGGALGVAIGYVLRP